MARLPSRLQPAWPLVKRGHRLATRTVGAVTRRTPVLAGGRPVPLRATDCAEDTARLEPDRVRLHLGGPAEHLDRPMPPGHPSGHWVFERWGRFDIPRRYTLDVTDGMVVGDYAAHITPGGTLDYETSTYFGITGWREHPIYLRHRLPASSRVSGSLVSLATRGSAGNYYHFVMDVLPRWGVLQETMPGFVPDRFFVNHGSRYQQQFLALLGLSDVSKVAPSRDTALQADRLLAPCIPNPELMAPRWTTGWLKSQLPARRTSGLPKRIYVTRGSAPNTRRVVNEPEVLSLLTRHGFEVFDPGTVSVQEQIDQFAAASVIVAPHGAALANLAFCNPGVRILELFAPRYVNPCYWVMAANIPDVHYRYLVCGPDPRGPGAPMNGVLTDITVDPALFADQLEQLLA